jgi:hypothetical protein
VLGGERVEGEDVLLDLFEHRGDLGERPLELGDRFAEPAARFLVGVGAEDRSDQGRQQSVLVLARVTEAIS